MAEPQIIKVVVVGDKAVKKTRLCKVFETQKPQDAYEYTVFDNLKKYLTVEGKDVILSLWDTAGQENYNNIRKLAYEGAHCFVLCFSLADKATLDGVEAVWLPELREERPEAHILLVGILPDPNADEIRQVTPHQTERFLCRNKLRAYVETSGRFYANDVERVFIEAVRMALGTSTLGTEESQGHV